jgi:predicted ATPase/class 3 adenylate cyclase
MKTCSVCGAENPVRFRFCGNCGTPFPPDEPSRRTRDFGRRAADWNQLPIAERRHLTVMFCDLVGSTALSLRLDPEELREVVRSYQFACAEVIERYDGWVAQYLGDGILAYFGYPTAHEDEGGRAARAALGVVQAIEQLNGRLNLPEGTELAVRVGIHTGEVVVAEMGGGARREHLALGDAPNIAARLQSLALPNTVVISDDTRRLIDRAIEVEDMGEPAMKGVGARRVYRIVREIQTDLSSSDAAIPFVGRHEELTFLEQRWGESIEGRGQVVVLVGDPGIGKSRLLQEFVRRAGFTACNRMETRCLPYYSNTAFFPFTDLLRRNLGCDPEQPPEQRLEIITRMLEREGFPLAETVPLFAMLMSVTEEEEPIDPAEPPARLKERMRAALMRLLLGAASQSPMILIVEDLHWADPSSLELLDEIVPLVADAQLLVLFTARHEFSLRWLGQDHVTHLAVRRLPDAEVDTMVRGLTSGHALPPDLVERIVARTDGVPLFIEELIRMLLESGMLREIDGTYVLDSMLPSGSIPVTLRDSLEARLDRLGRYKELAQLAATLGREFDYDLSRAVSDLSESRLRAGLEALVEAGLLLDEGDFPHVHYSFKHALIQEAAYQSLLRTARQAHHLRIANTLVKSFPETARTQPELLAHHYTEAGVAGEAIEAWTRAGRLALQRSANAEAVAHLSRGLDLVDRIPEGEKRTQAELDLLALLAPALVTTRGYAAPEVQTAYNRARTLAQSAKRTRHLCQMLAGLFAHHFVRGELEAAGDAANELLRIAAEHDDDNGLQLVADAAAGVAAFGTGDLARAGMHLERVVSEYDPVRHGPMAVALGQDLGVVGNAYSAYVLGITGRPDAARERAREAVAAAERISHPHSMALALALKGGLHHALLDVETVHSTATRLRELSVSQRFSHWEMEALDLLSWVAAVEGRFDVAFELTSGCATAARQLGASLPHTFFQPTIIEILLMAGRASDALHASSELMGILGKRRMRWSLEPEVIRLRGRALEELNDIDEAERTLEQAMELAGQRGAHLFELRAASDLAELHLRTARGDDIREILLPRLDMFTEGDDIQDVLRARGILGRMVSV